ncbi:MAG TPA: alpha-amylase family glycosyl hydrolase [Candidatus Eremiobacteraceae bacterium]|nr:alpha-amylase family glycosyl hydrolase [Candidatus Eremiobacteraceae bacterium]
MFTSLFAPEVQAVLDNAESAAGQAGGPFPSPADWRDQVIYFLMVDRFNNPAAAPVHQPYDDPNYAQYQYGKFSGVQQQLAYIKSLGAGAIWLSPVLKNLPFDQGSYHGYGIHDFLRAEPYFATNPANADDELRALVDAAHQAGLYVIFDIVLNHIGDAFAYNGNSTAPFSSVPMPIQWRDASGTAQPQWNDIAAIQNPPIGGVVWPSELHQNQYFRRQGMPDPNGADTVGDFDSLKQMMTVDPDLQGFLIRAYQYVIARYDIDGFRIDTLRYLQGNLAQLFGNSVREFALSIGKKNFFTFGEVLDSNSEEDIARFIGRNTTTGSDADSLVGVDAALDYPLFNVLTPTVKGFSAPAAVVAMYNLRKQVEQFILSSHGDASRFFVTFLDNHDMKARIRYVQPGNEHEFDDQVTMGVACLYSLPGVPCLYYGTEQGLHGFGTDPAVREALWGISPTLPQNSFFYPEIQEVVAVRNAQPALRYGRFYFRPISGDSINFGISPYPGGILAWSRILNDQEVLIAANTNTTQSQSVDVILEATLSAPGDNLRVLYSNKSAPTAPAPVRTLTQVTVAEVDGTTGTGPLNTVRVTLQPMEAQLLRI